MECIKTTVKTHCILPKSAANFADHDDSGVDMGYSSDEKKKTLISSGRPQVHKKNILPTTNGIENS